MTIKQLANQLGVSKTTISKAIFALASEKSQTANQNALIEVLQKQLSLLNKQLSIKDDRFFLQSILWKDNDLFFCFYGKRPSCSGAVCRTVFLSLYRYFSRTHQGQVRGVLKSTIKKFLFYDHGVSSRIGIVCIYLSTVVIFVNLQTSGYC